MALVTVLGGASGPRLNLGEEEVTSGATHYVPKTVRKTSSKRTTGRKSPKSRKHKSRKTKSRKHKSRSRRHRA